MSIQMIDTPVALTFIPDVPYGEADGTRLLLDVVCPPDPSSTLRPAVIWLHGFGWFAGSRRDKLEVSLCTFLAAHGFFTVTIEYRLSGEAPFPAQLHDVKAAIRWLRAHAAPYHIDPEHIGIWGASAGGHLAALAGLTGDVPALEGRSGSPGLSSRVQAVVVASAPSDFLRPGGALRNDRDGPVSWLFGGTVAEKEALMRSGSPLSHVSPAAPPFLIAHGTLDETVPFEQAEHLYHALVRAGVEAELIPVEGVYHNWTTQVEQITRRADTWKVGPMALPFFQKHLMPRANVGERALPLVFVPLLSEGLVRAPIARYSASTQAAAPCRGQQLERRDSVGKR